MLMQQALEILDALLKDGGRARSIFYVNAHTLNLACEDRDFRAVLNRANYVFGDGPACAGRCAS